MARGEVTAAVIAFAKPEPRYVPQHVTDLTDMATLACKAEACGRQWLSPNPVALHAKGVAVEHWRCPFCHGNALGIVENSTRKAPPRG